VALLPLATFVRFSTPRFALLPRCVAWGSVPDMPKRTPAPEPEWWVIDKHKLVEALDDVRDMGHDAVKVLQRLLAESYSTSFTPEK